METNTNSLPLFQRKTPGFQETLLAEAAEIIEAMDEAGDDIPHQRPEFLIDLPSVGVVREHVPLQILDPFGSGATCVISCRIEAHTHVPSEKRGIHMSRIGSLIAEKTQNLYQNLESCAVDLARTLNEAEYGVSSKVKVSGIFSYLEQVTGWKESKHKTSLEHIELSATASVQGKKLSTTIGLGLNHITACPCVQETYKHALLKSKGDIQGAIETVAPMLTHSQRCHTFVELSGLEEPVSIKELLRTLDQVLYRVQNTLPREYEVLLVYRAHKEPQFLEDAMRQVLASLYKLLSEKHPNSRVRLSASSMESIHDFDITSDLQFSMEELQQRLH